MRAKAPSFCVQIDWLHYIKFIDVYGKIKKKNHAPEHTQKKNETHSTLEFVPKRGVIEIMVLDFCLTWLTFFATYFFHLYNKAITPVEVCFFLSFN